MPPNPPLSWPPDAATLRSRFRAIPKNLRDAHQPFCIRVWRAVSWLERAENAAKDDLEGRFISAWIGFNALYGQLDNDGQPWGDREARSTFLARIGKLDANGGLPRIMKKRQLLIFRTIEDKYLSQRFWMQGASAAKQVKRELRDAMTWIDTPKQPRVLQMLFDRLYVLRNQLLHGASTKGSSLNRRPLRECGNLLAELLAVMLVVMIEQGVATDWGRVCFAPDGPQ